MNQALSKVLANVTPSSSKVAVRIYLIRHGQTNWNRRGKIQGGGYDVPLNENGRNQAKKAASALEGIPLDAVASSSLSRAKETADILWEEHKGAEPLRIVDEGFNEMRFGEFEGLRYRPNQDDDGKADDETIQKLKEHLSHFLVAKNRVQEDPDYRFPSRTESSFVEEEDEVYRVDNEFGTGESTRIVEDRTMEALSRTIDRLLPQRHGFGSASTTATKHIAIVSHGRTNKVFIASMLTGDAHTGYGQIRQDNANISVLDYVCDETGDVSVNENGHVTRPPSFWKGIWTARVLNYTDHVQET